MAGSYMAQIGMVLALGLGALGSSLGILTAGVSAAGAWARDARAGKPISFTYIIFVAAPISQTLYAMIVMNNLSTALSGAQGAALAVKYAGQFLAIGLATGLGELASAWGQGIIGAAACRCLSEGEGKGFAFLVIAIGIIETVGIFTMVFMLGMVPKA